MTKKDRVGETRRMNCGMDAIIVVYRKANDMDIRFKFCF